MPLWRFSSMGESSTQRLRTSTQEQESEETPQSCCSRVYYVLQCVWLIVGTIVAAVILGATIFARNLLDPLYSKLGHFIKSSKFMPVITCTVVRGLPGLLGPFFPYVGTELLDVSYGVDWGTWRGLLTLFPGSLLGSLLNFLLTKLRKKLNILSNVEMPLSDLMKDSPILVPSMLACSIVPRHISSQLTTSVSLNLDTSVKFIIIFCFSHIKEAAYTNIGSSDFESYSKVAKGFYFVALLTVPFLIPLLLRFICKDNWVFDELPTHLHSTNSSLNFSPPRQPSLKFRDLFRDPFRRVDHNLPSPQVRPLPPPSWSSLFRNPSRRVNHNSPLPQVPPPPTLSWRSLFRNPIHRVDHNSPLPQVPPPPTPSWRSLFKPIRLRRS